jgi:hypothetical protein
VSLDELLNQDAVNMAPSVIGWHDARDSNAMLSKVFQQVQLPVQRSR